MVPDHQPRFCPAIIRRLHRGIPPCTSKKYIADACKVYDKILPFSLTMPFLSLHPYLACNCPNPGHTARSPYPLPFFPPSLSTRFAPVSASLHTRFCRIDVATHFYSPRFLVLDVQQPSRTALKGRLQIYSSHRTSLREATILQCLLGLRSRTPGIFLASSKG